MSTTPARRKPVIGIVGGIGSGKSTVARMFESLGCGVIDADRIAKAALDDDAVKSAIIERWGAKVLDDAGKVDRGALGRIVFKNPDELLYLESVVHPVVHRRRAEVRRAMFENVDTVAVVEDTPLLLEKGLAGECDVLVFVEASAEVRRERVRSKRGWSEKEWAERENRQWPLDKKADQADYVVSNEGEESQTLDRVRLVLSQILQEFA
ncbi:MAG: dephospho-CoA kinase [Phycisphaera sp.]|nr:dephospho-CoA kinase [Phycisphaera sp.]